MTIPVLYRHDAGCRYARGSDGGHDDDAKRLSDAYNLHKMIGERGGWLAVRLADGSTDSTVYDTRESAVAHQHHNERWNGYVQLAAPSMSVCAAAAVLRWQRQTTKVAPPQRDELGGGLVVIPRLGAEGIGNQLRAMRSGGFVALGRKR